MGWAIGLKRQARFLALAAALLGDSFATPTNAIAQSGVIVGHWASDDVRIARYDPSAGGWVSLVNTVKASITYDRNRVARLYALPPGRYGFVEIRGGGRTEQAPILKGGQGGAGAVYSLAVGEFVVRPNEIARPKQFGMVSLWPVDDTLAKQLLR